MDSDPRRERPSNLLQVAVAREGEQARVVPVGEVCLGTAPDLDKTLRAVTSSQDVRRVVVDLAGVTFLDASGLHVLLEATSLANQDGFDLGIARTPDRIRRLFVLAGVDQRLPLVKQ